ncbi:MAG: glycerol kinase GlpK [Nitrospirota bacterium]|nr:MAG: glycerol kinase GlpK [Nitrospirota bacterium]
MSNSRKLILTIDQGTTGTRGVVVDRRGKVHGSAYSEFTQYYPRPGWVEHDAEEIWRVSLRVVRAALRNARVRQADLAAIGITNQRETTLVWNRRTGRPIHRAIVWQDRRTAKQCDKLRRRGLNSQVRDLTGLVLDPYFSATKLQWLLDHVRNARGRAGDGELLFGTIDTWLVWKLSGGRAHVTDRTNASRTLLFNLNTLDWDDTLLTLFDIPRRMLPAVCPSMGVVGETDPEVFGAAVPIAGIAGDQQAALFGQTCFTPGVAKNTYGTGCFVLMPTGGKVVRSAHLLTTVAASPQDTEAYSLEGSIFAAGAAVRWLRDGLRLIRKAEETEQLATSVPSTGGIYMVPAFVGLGAPFWDPHARGAILGLTLGTNRAHVARAVLEAIAYQTRDVVEAMMQATREPVEMIRADGGAASNDFLMQFQADILGIEVERPKVIETSALGAAYLAGLGVGFWDSTEEISHLRKVDRRFRPRIKPSERENLYEGWMKAVSRVRTRRGVSLPSDL